MSVLFFLLFLPILYFLLLKNRKKSSLKGFNLPPSPPKLPIIGNLHQLGHLPHQSLQKLSHKHGPVMLLQLGSRPTLVVSSAEAAKDLLKTHDLDCCNRPPSPAVKKLSYNYSNISFAPYGDYWKEMRPIFISELVSMRVKSFAYAREARIDKLISTLSQDPATPGSLDQNIFSLAVGIIGTVAFGNMYGKNLFKSEEIQTVITDVMNMVSDLSVEDLLPSAVGRFVDALIGVTARREKNFQKLDKFFELVLEKHLDPARPKPEQEDFVDFLIKLREEQSTSFRMTRDHVKGVVLDAFLGGLNSTAVTILWTISELIKNPRVMKKVQSEIRSCIGKKSKLDDDDVEKLKYLKMVVKETFRLHPAFPLLLPYETSGQCKIGGYDVFPGTRVFVNAFASGRDPNSWRNPDEFCPERFENRDTDGKQSGFDLLQFGAGRRGCPAGYALGAKNVEFALANLLYCFDWKLPGGMTKDDFSMEEGGRLIIHRKTPLVLVPIRFGWAENE